MSSADHAKLSSAMRAATASLHRDAEQAGIMPDMLSGCLAEADYVRLLINLHALYARMENLLSATGELTQLERLLDGGLRRSAALEHDLVQLAGPTWQALFPESAALSGYLTRLSGIAAESPPLLAAHAYVRYLGDLNGGRILARLVLNGPCKARPDAVRFYMFPASMDIQDTQGRFRSVLDDLGDRHQDLWERMLDEARHGFVFHIELFKELDALRRGRAAHTAS